MKIKAFFSGCFFLLILSLSLFIRSVDALDADDVTLIGKNEALFSLKENKTAEILTSADEKAVIEINDGIVNEGSILIRFIVWGLPQSWESKISDQNRLNGSYLPIAELGIPSGEWLTPGSGSHFSFINQGDTLIIAGLLEFLTNETPEIVSFDFNQIPFDEQPLKEGAVIVLDFEAGDSRQRIEKKSVIDEKSGVFFSLLNTAQTPEISMIQPALSVSRTDEQISRVGWVSLSQSDGKKYVLKRDYAYGFNIADDDRFMVNNSYIFQPIHDAEPRTISLDFVYVKRKSAGEVKLSLEAISEEQPFIALDIPLSLDEFSARISGYSIYQDTAEDHHTIPTLRLFMDSEGPVSSINFSTGDSDSELMPAVCGFLPETEQFACDVPLLSMDQTELTLNYDSFEYRIDGNWSFQWNPFPIPARDQTSEQTVLPYKMDSMNFYDGSDPEVEKTVKKIQEFSAALSSKSGWILQRYETKISIAGGDYPDLIDHSQKNTQMNHIIEESWDQIQPDGTVLSNISLVRNLSGQIISGTWNLADRQIVLPQGLLIQNQGYNTGYVYPFVYGSDFYTLFRTNAKIVEQKECEYENRSAWCYRFFHTLGSAKDIGNLPENSYLFWIEQKTGKILQKQIDCQLNGIDQPSETCVVRKTLEIRHSDDLDSEIRNLIESFIY